MCGSQGRTLDADSEYFENGSTQEAALGRDEESARAEQQLFVLLVFADSPSSV